MEKDLRERVRRPGRLHAAVVYRTWYGVFQTSLQQYHWCMPNTVNNTAHAERGEFHVSSPH